MRMVNSSIGFLKNHITNARDWFAAYSTLGTTVQVHGTQATFTCQTPSFQTKSNQTWGDPFLTPEPIQSTIFDFSNSSGFLSEISDDSPLGSTPGDPFLAPNSTKNRELVFLDTNHNNTLINPSCFLRTANLSPALTSGGIDMLLDAADMISHWDTDSPITHKNRERAEVVLDLDMDQFQSHGSETSSVETVKEVHTFRSPLPTCSLHLASRKHNQLQSSSRHRSDYTTCGARHKQHGQLHSLSRFRDPGSGVVNQSFNPGMIRYQPYPNHKFQNAAPGIVKQLRSRSVESSSVRAGTRRHKSGSSLPTPPLQNSTLRNFTPVVLDFPPRSTQELLLPQKDRTSDGNDPAVLQVEGSKAREKKEEAMSSISNCQCRFSATQSILATALGPLGNLLESNTCDGHKYKQTAQIFLNMFDEVRRVQDFDGHVHNCPNSVV